MTVASALISCTVLGLQHGIDVDHVAAISDVTSIQPTAWYSARSGLLYAAGHAGTVGLLGLVFIEMRSSLPVGLAAWMQKFVGLTLIVLAACVLRFICTSSVPVGRGSAILALINSVRRRAGDEPASAASSYGPSASLSLGVLHGVGAETPTQLSVLLIAANLGGLGNGMLGLSAFTAGMFASNMALTTAATGVFELSKTRPWMFRWLGALTSFYSVWIGIGLIVR